MMCRCFKRLPMGNSPDAGWQNQNNITWIRWEWVQNSQVGKQIATINLKAISANCNSMKK